MKSKGDTLQELVQSRLPHTRVFLDTQDKLFEEPCELFAINLKNTKKNGSINYQDGIAEHSAETLADDFVILIGPDVAE